MQGGPVTSSNANNQRIYDGATTAMMKQRKDKVKASSGTKIYNI
jgi:hypothetical protein